MNYYSIRVAISILITISLTLYGEMLWAQDSGPSLSVDNSRVEVSDTLDGWDYNLMAELSGSQTSFSNWSQGGVNSISGSASSWFDAKYRKDRFGYLLSTNLKYGKARLEGEGTRKTSDQISIKNKFTHNFRDKPYSLYGNFDFSTQFDEGIDYATEAGEQDQVISRFMAPGYFRQSLGFSYDPFSSLTIEAGIGFKETYMRDSRLSERYGLEAGETFRFEAGGALNISFEKQIMENIMLQSSFESFANIQKSLKHTDFEFSNQLVGSVNKYINTTLNFVMVYDRDFSTELQIKQMFSAGLRVNLL